jgi:hypothetical protein|tara:strand:+ start:412 stop:738 length:327 start_codon:yes stop_codon:yes gene_type:complete
MPALTKDDFDNAYAFGCYINDSIVDGDGNKTISNSKLDDMRWQLEDSGLAEILKNYTLFSEEDITNLLGTICEKSDTNSPEWESISRVIYYEYMNPKPSGRILEELSL